jgi:hypothetical protein
MSADFNKFLFATAGEGSTAVRAIKARLLLTRNRLQRAKTSDAPDRMPSHSITASRVKGRPSGERTGANKNREGKSPPSVETSDE